MRESTKMILVPFLRKGGGRLRKKPSGLVVPISQTVPSVNLHCSNLTDSSKKISCITGLVDELITRLFIHYFLIEIYSDSRLIVCEHRWSVVFPRRDKKERGELFQSGCFFRYPNRGPKPMAVFFAIQFAHIKHE